MPEENTPLHDKLQAESKTEATAPDPTKAAQPVDFRPADDYLKDADPVDVTSFPEDDDPLSLAGDFVDEDGDGVDDRKGKS